MYAERPDSAVERPARWLVGFETVELDAGRVRRRRGAACAGASSPTGTTGWTWEPGDFSLLVGTSVDDTPVRLDLSVK